MDIHSIQATWIAHLTDPGGTLLLLPLLLPLIGLLLALIPAGRLPGRAVLGLMLPGLAVAFAIATILVAGGDVMHYHLGGWVPPRGVALRADGRSAVMLVTTALVILAVGIYGHREFRPSRGESETRASLATPGACRRATRRQRHPVGAGGHGLLLYDPAHLVRSDAGPPSLPGVQIPGAMGAAAILFGNLIALRQVRLKLLIAYSTVAQLGYLFLIFPLAAKHASFALTGGMLQVVSHACAKAAMFMAAGLIAGALGHDRIRELGGIGRVLPITVFAFGPAGLSLVGVQPSGGYLTKTLLSLAADESGSWWWGRVIQAGGLLTAAYLFRVLGHALARPAWR